MELKSTKCTFYKLIFQFSKLKIQNINLDNVHFFGLYCTIKLQFTVHETQKTKTSLVLHTASLLFWRVIYTQFISTSYCLPDATVIFCNLYLKYMF